MATRRATTSTASAAPLWVFAHRAIWLRLFPIRETWRVRSRSTSAAGTDQVRARAIARRISAESGTPAAFALARHSADSSGVRRTATKTGRRLATGMRRQGGNGGDAPARAIHRSAGQLGIEGAESLASPRVIPGVCWLVGLNMRQASLGSALRNASPGTARNSLDGAVAAKLPGLLAAGLTDCEGENGALRRPSHSTRPIPLGDPGSSILRDPVARRSPEMPPCRPITASEPSRLDDRPCAP